MLSHLPREILLQDILTLLDSRSLINLSIVSTYFSYLVNDEHIWKRLCLQEFNISPDNAFRYKGWKQLYIALKVDIKVLTWGENKDNRLGLRQSQTLPVDGTFTFQARNPRLRHSNEVSEPQEVVSLQEKSIIDITSGGWSFHALDTHGSVWMWGTLQQDISPRDSLGTRRLIEPTKLQATNETQEKVSFRSISSGRGHVIGLARDDTVWHWSNHVTLQRVLLPLQQHERVVQVVANWAYSSVLTNQGALFIIPKPDLIIPSQAPVEPAATQIVTPAIHYQELTEQHDDDDEIVQIAGLDGYTIALTRLGRVLKLATHSNEFTQDPKNHVINLKHFGSTDKNEKNERDGSMKRFITGGFENFAVYTKDGQVLLGKVEATEETEPTILPDLQNRDVCKVSFGDYHTGALTTTGNVLTWGNYSSGALGHGTDHLRQPQPTPKVVESLCDMFVFAIGFGGWQSSVLAIPLDQDHQEGATTNQDEDSNFIRTDI